MPKPNILFVILYTLILIIIKLGHGITYWQWYFFILQY